MLTADDRMLVDRDPAVPGLGVVLDPAAVAEMIDDASGGGCTDVRPTHVKYKHATSCVVGYRVSGGDGAQNGLIFAKALRPSAAAKLRKAVEKAVPDTVIGWGVVAGDDVGAYVATAANDRDLPAVRLLGCSPRRDELLRRLIPDDRRVVDHEVRLIRHKPERRWIGVIDIDGEPTYRIKAYRLSDIGRALAGHRVVGGSAVVLGSSRRHGVIASEWIDGVSVASLLAESRPADLAALGATLAELHLRPLDDRGRHDQSPRIRSGRIRHELRTAAEAVTVIEPGSSELAAKVARRAARGIGDGADVTLVHGDFSADQVVLSDSEVHLIDFDESGVGDPVMDLASFSADLQCAEIDGRVPPGTADPAFAEMVDGYRAAGGPAMFDHFDAHLAGGLLRRAVEPFRDRRPEWAANCAALVDRAGVLVSTRTMARR